MSLALDRTSRPRCIYLLHLFVGACMEKWKHFMQKVCGCALAVLRLARPQGRGRHPTSVSCRHIHREKHSRPESPTQHLPHDLQRLFQHRCALHRHRGCKIDGQVNPKRPLEELRQHAQEMCVACCCAVALRVQHVAHGETCSSGQGCVL